MLGGGSGGQRHQTFVTTRPHTCHCVNPRKAHGPLWPFQRCSPFAWAHPAALRSHFTLGGKAACCFSDGSVALVSALSPTSGFPAKDEMGSQRSRMGPCKRGRPLKGPKGAMGFPGIHTVTGVRAGGDKGLGPLPTTPTPTHIHAKLLSRAAGG